MARRIQFILLIAVIAIMLAAGCTAPVPNGSIPNATTVPALLPTTSVINGAPTPLSESTVNGSENMTTGPVPVNQTIPTEIPSPIATTSIAAETTTTAPVLHEIYYGNVVIYMDREGYALINFEDFGYPILKPGEKYIVRITADHAILPYVIRSYDTGLLNTVEGTPTYDSYDRTYDYGRLSPILKLGNIYDGGDEFTVKDLGKYTLVLDARLSTRDYRIANEVTRVAVRILKVE
jgi:hypothetical protein